MSTQKLCPECEAANQPYAAICANCGHEFSVPPSPPPDTAPSTASPRAPEYHSPHPLSPPPQRQITKRYLLYGVIGLLALLIVAAAFAAGISPSPLTSTAPAAAPPMQAPIAASTPISSASPITPVKTPAASANQESAARAGMVSAPFLSPALLSGSNSGAQTYTARSAASDVGAYSFQGYPEAQKAESQNPNIPAHATTDVTTGENAIKTTASPITTDISPTGTSSTGVPSPIVTVSAPTTQEEGWNTVTVKYPADGTWKTDTAVNPNGNGGVAVATKETTAGDLSQHVTYGGSSVYGNSISTVANVNGPLNTATVVPTATSVGGTPPVTIDVTTPAGVDAAMVSCYTPPSAT